MITRAAITALALAIFAAACAVSGGDASPIATLDAGSDARAMCVLDGDCPASAARCAQAACSAGQCGTRNYVKGTIVGRDKPCSAILCDGAGSPVRVVDMTALPPIGDPCLVGTCDEMGAAGTAFAAAGKACASNQRCDGAGNCVECLVAADCPATHTCNVLNHCEAPPCSDGFRDQRETDVDCGGPICAPCRGGKICKVDSDCTTRACDPIMKICLAPSCSDGTRDNNETDVDCGGACGACTVGKRCGVDQDCLSSACDAIARTCATDACHDHHKSTLETDVDCGGPSCAKCVDGLACRYYGDCASNVCDPQRLVCIPYVDPCTDGVRTGSETDVDCGGGMCPGCALGQMCLLDFDCTSHACDGISAVCVSDACTDHRVDGGETDVDCGGANACARCVLGKKCIATTDCAPGLACALGNPHVCL